VIHRAETSICQFDHWAIEGGVWQGKRVLAVLGGRFISAKGRPNQKLVENGIGRLWNIMAGLPGDVGRYQAENKVDSQLYVAARAGRIDPRKHFLSLQAGQEALYAAIQYGNEKRLDSRTYGSWIPQSRWEMDLAAHPREVRCAADDFLILPCAETRKVRRGSIQIAEDGPHGIRMIWTFAADWLWRYEGAEVTCYFDPLRLADAPGNRRLRNPAPVAEPPGSEISEVPVFVEMDVAFPDGRCLRRSVHR